MSFSLFENKQTSWLDRVGNIKADVDVVTVSLVKPQYHAGYMTREHADGLLAAHNQQNAISLTCFDHAEKPHAFEGKVAQYRGLGEGASERIEIELEPVVH